MERYRRNIGMLSPQENDQLKNYKVCVIGCGGLGGYIIELLGRLGIGTITAVDGDIFESSNLNRQILSDAHSLGKSKAFTAKERMLSVNPLITVHPIAEKFTRENGKEILAGHHVIVDALDNIESRMILQDITKELNIPFVHGAIAGWYGQVSTVFPEDQTLNIIYSHTAGKGIEQELGNPSFTPSLIASIQVSEVLKILIGRGNLLRKKILYINLLDQEYFTIDL
ncbi:HesA/MoeB/ThiF family protein [Clostridiaceae bacterium 35-E11]